MVGNMKQAKTEKSLEPFGSHPCNICGFKGKTASVLKQHVTVTHTDKDELPFKCDFPVCEYRTTNKYNLAVHKRRQHAENKDQYKVHTCDQCDYKAEKKSQLLRHAAIHSDERPAECDFPSCSYRAKTQHQLNRHRKHHDCCSICGFSSRFKDYVVKHSRIHRGETYACGFPGCNYRARQLGTLKRHRFTHDPNSMLKCDLPDCEFRTAHTRSLKRHQETHNPERKRYLHCPMCPKTFSVKHILRNHIKVVHTKERTFSCSNCDLTFTSKMYLRLHTVKVHPSKATGTDTILKKYKCTACEYSHISRARIACHQRSSHSNIRDFACDKCDYRAKCKIVLRSHQNLRHALHREKSVGCPQCWMKFFTRKECENHVKTVHRPDKLYKCHQCEFATNYADSLRCHLKKHHPPETGRSLVLEQQVQAAGGRNRESANNQTDNQSFRCEFPGCSFTSAYHTNLKLHERRDCAEMQNIQCPMCPRKFFARPELHNHISHERETF